MVSGSDEEVDGLLHHVDLASIRAELMPSLEELSPALEHRKVAVRWRVVVSALPVGQRVVDRGLRRIPVRRYVSQMPRCPAPTREPTSGVARFAST